ncbi:MAG: CDP-alcohol phosphatidyltransferase family protein [Cyanobacteria bacterium J06632_3]
MLKSIPKLLIALRFLIAAGLFWAAAHHYSGRLFIVGYCIAITSDIFDGIIARRLGISTPQLRQTDSWADITLFLVLAISTWWLYPAVILAFKVPLLIALLGQLSLFSLCLIKFKKMPSYHTYTAKAWGLGLLVAVISLYGFEVASPLWVAIGLCWINTLEEIVITLLLDEWHCDVLSLFHARNMTRTQSD